MVARLAEGFLDAWYWCQYWALEHGTLSAWYQCWHRVSGDGALSADISSAPATTALEKTEARSWLDGECSMMTTMATSMGLGSILVQTIEL